MSTTSCEISPPVHQQPQHLGAKQPLDQASVEVREALERLLPIEHPVRHQQLHVRMPVEQLAHRLDEPDGARHRQLEALVGGAPEPPTLGDEPVAVIKWVDGTLIDTVWRVEG